MDVPIELEIYVDFQYSILQYKTEFKYFVFTNLEAEGQQSIMGQ